MTFVKQADSCAPIHSTLNSERKETFAIAVRLAKSSLQVRAARKVAADTSSDVELLKIDGPPLPALRPAARSDKLD